MKKDLLVSAIRQHHRSGGSSSVAGFLLFFADYLEKLSIPSDEEFDFWQIDDCLPAIVVMAYEVYATKFPTRGVSSLTDIGTSNLLAQSSEVIAISSEFDKIMGGKRFIERNIRSYCNAQSVVVQQVFDEFVRKVYHKGLFKFIDECKSRGMSGKFGDTELRSFVTAGRIMMTFARGSDTEDRNLTFIGEEGDPLLLSAGIQLINVPLFEAVDMIKDVIRHWPKDPVPLDGIYGPNNAVTIG